MCGIAGIITKHAQNLPIRDTLLKLSQSLQHRGPDGEGFLCVSAASPVPYYHAIKPDVSSQGLSYVPSDVLPQALQDTSLAFVHRRLAIIDTTAGGHQPMCDKQQKVWLTYNGEIYNYVELKQELTELGHQFVSHSDSEVLIAAYLQWGTDCVQHFNGMWSFCLYDTEHKICFASRDRLGVKPFYYLNTTQCFAFASEQKALVKSGLVKAKASAAAVSAYLLEGALEQEPENFFEGITELMPGHNLVYELNKHTFSLTRYYRIENSFSTSNEALDDKALSSLIRTCLDEAVRIRLRSDVEVGTCLSGGIDSSALAVTMARHSMRPIHCFTSVFRGDANNEESFAESVVLRIRGIHHKIEPDLHEFQSDINDLIYSQDVPIWSTSTYAQHQVMSLAKQHGIKVVLDGQGADELFAGYHHHFIARWNQLCREGKKGQAALELLSMGKSIPVPLLFYFKEKLKQSWDPRPNVAASLLRSDYTASTSKQHAANYFNSLNEQLADDISRARLKIFLKCEDRAGMWHSVESRTPFSDDLPLIEAAFSFNGSRKIKYGVSKFFLREAVRAFLPEEIYKRYDKIGFETPMNRWMQALGPQMKEEITAAKFDFVNTSKLESLSLQDQKSSALVFKLFVLARWKKIFDA